MTRQRWRDEDFVEMRLGTWPGLAEAHELVAADVSRRKPPVRRKYAPTDVGGYDGVRSSVPKLTDILPSRSQSEP